MLHDVHYYIIGKVAKNVKFEIFLSKKRWIKVLRAIFKGAMGVYVKIRSPSLV